MKPFNSTTLMTENKYRRLAEKLVSVIGKDRVFNDPLHTLAYGTDASFYRLVPKLVVRANSESEVKQVIELCSEAGISVTFRAAGTSLSGQAVTDSVLLIAGDNWRHYSISDNGDIINLQPGLTGEKVNSLLMPFGKKIGPDPASINSAMIGGIAANNASGMCCGTAQNSYNTVSGIKVIFADGSVLDTRDAKSKEEFESSHPAMIAGINALALTAKENVELAGKIRRKYKMKNTTGYSLNALIDFTDPFDIIEHLMIGSEGTLGFISEITYRTVDNHPFRASSLIIFPDITKACMAVSLLKSAPVAAVELIDRTGMRSVENENGLPSFISSLDDNACALLAETTALSGRGLISNIERISDSIKNIETVSAIGFTSVPEEYEKLWKIRKGLFPTVGAMRKSGTTVIIEDVAFPIERLAEATTDLRNVLNKYGYEKAVIFGHALEGNLHFVFSQDFSTKNEVERYSLMISEVSSLVVNIYGGSLKAEHGTGRNMAPFVELEWGKEAYELMKRIKQLFDPQNILNPGVILNPDKEIHLKNLKPVAPSDEITDKCTECGFCEVTCVSAGLTLTPRQRIVVRREILSLEAGGERKRSRQLKKLFRYNADATCATDGLCALACPVRIDCGKMIKSIREERSDGAALAMSIAKNMRTTTALARFALSSVSFFHTIFGTAFMKAVSRGIRIASFNSIPAWNEHMPTGARKIRIDIAKTAKERKVVYFPSCINRSMGPSKDQDEEMQLSRKLIVLLEKAGYEIIFPENIDKLCCGMAFSSKGYTSAGNLKSLELESALLKASQNGKYPVLCDMSPCLYTMKSNMSMVLQLHEPVEFLLDHVVQYLRIHRADETITVFPVCSMKKMGLEQKLVKLASLCAKEVIVTQANCCGFAGDRGFTFPELNRHGLRDLRRQLPDDVKTGYSNSRTCEIGLSLHSGISYKSIVYLVDKVSE